MISSSLAGHILELFYIFNTSKSPTNQITKEYFRSRRYLGSHDRRAIANTVFGLIRHRRFLETLFEEYLKQNPKIEIPKERFIYNLPLLEAYCEIIDTGIKIPSSLWKTHLPEIEITSYINWIKDNSSLEFLGKDQLLQTGVKYSFPDWMVDIFQKQIGNEIEMLLDALNTQAPTTLRVNILITTREECQARLRSEGIETTYSKISPVGLIANKRFNSQALNSYKDGWFEIQDEGSQLISYALAPKENSLILDACAGAGGKTLHIADLTKNNAIIYASDIEYGRLKEISKRSQRCNFTHIYPKYIKNQDINELKKLFDYKEFDYVLIDAPCSGLGTIRRDPTRKYKVTHEFIERISNKQYKILSQYSKFVKIGGILVYATCSLLNEENQKIIERFLNENINFEPSSLIEAFNTYNIYIDDLKNDDFQLSIGFDKYSFDCFYMARLKRIK